MDRPKAGPPDLAKASPDQQSDAAALERITRGDAGGFDGLVDRFKHQLFRHIRRRVNDPHRAEDLTQEVFLRLFRAAQAGGYSGQASVVTWLFTIVNNCVTDHLRAEGRRSTLPSERIKSDEQGSPISDATRRESDFRIRQLLDELPEAQRRVVELHVLDGLSFGEVAELVGCPIPTAKSRLVYGLRKLKQSLIALQRSET